MPKRKKSVRSRQKHSRKKTIALTPEPTKRNLLFQLTDSYTSLFLGVVVIGIVILGILGFLKLKNTIKLPVHQETLSTNIQKATKPTPSHSPRTYTVQQGEGLWQISEKVYKSGYNWVDIAKANNIDAPYIVYTGTKLIMPDVAVKDIGTAASTNTLTQQQSITGTTYRVQQGDCLWDIAVRAYGDGYKWVDIAKANTIQTPDLIYSGTKLTLPRS